MNRTLCLSLCKNLHSALATVCLALALIIVPLAFGSDDESIGEKTSDKSNAADSEASITSDNESRVSLAVARDRAILMHRIYTSTLDVMHHRYFHVDRSIVPARAMEDVFSDLERETGSKANWISVNLKAMSLNHEPASEFEKQAAREIAAGRDEIEVVEDGFYRRATPIPLHGGCVSCHAGFSPQQSKKQKFAGLVISIPVTAQAVVHP